MLTNTLHTAELVAHRAQVCHCSSVFKQQHFDIGIVDNVGDIVRPVHGIQRTPPPSDIAA